MAEDDAELRLGIDTGGTYTDAVLVNDTGEVAARAKALTTHHDLVLGITEAVDGVLAGSRAEAGTVRLVSLSTTLATNALVEGHGSRACVLLVGQPPGLAGRARLRDVVGDDPVVNIAGGHVASGAEQAVLDTGALARAATVHSASVSAFAVSSYFAVRNPAHELAARDLLRDITDLPVCLSHELTSELDAPRRTLTTVLNARLIPLIGRLLAAVESLLAARGILAPLMVVRGDGSLVAAAMARARPVETILSGPAASAVGALHLCAERDAVIADIGGTTTDIVLVRNARPALRREGAVVGGWRTMVEAIDVRTAGIGGDSEVSAYLRPSPDGGVERRLEVGPRRVVPVSLAAARWPSVVETLEAQLRAEPLTHQGRFARRARERQARDGALGRSESALWEALHEVPVPLTRLAAEMLFERPLRRLVNRGLAQIVAFTPSDAAHVLGLQDTWSAPAARLAAAIWLRGEAAAGWPSPGDEREFARSVVEQVAYQCTDGVIGTALASLIGEESARRELEGPLLREVWQAGGPSLPGLLSLSLTLGVALVAIGAPAALYFPRVATRLGARLVVPPHADVCNAVGAVAGGVVQRVRVLITAPAEGVYRAHLAQGVRDFPGLESAAAQAEQEAGRLARDAALAAGGMDVELTTARRDNVVQGPGGHEVFVESVVTVTAAGRPAVGR